MAKFDRRTSFVCYPASAAAAFTIAPGWLTILRPGIGAPKVITAVGEQSVTARIECKHTWPVKVGDFLSDTFDDRVLLVKQVERKQQRQEFLCEEIRRPLPDRFDTRSLKGYWQNELTLPDNPQYYGSLYFALPSGTNFLNAKMLWQRVSGDFDIWADVNIESLDEGNYGPAGYGLLMARDPATKYGVGVGQRWLVSEDVNQVYRLVRVDYNANGQSVGTEAPPYAGGGGSLFRLQRTEGVLRAYRGKSVPSNTPLDEYEFPADFWVQIGLGSFDSHFISSAPLDVGIGGWLTGSATYAYVATQAIRNWLSR